MSLLCPRTPEISILLTAGPRRRSTPWACRPAMASKRPNPLPERVFVVSFSDLALPILGGQGLPMEQSKREWDSILSGSLELFPLVNWLAQRALAGSCLPSNMGFEPGEYFDR